MDGSGVDGVEAGDDRQRQRTTTAAQRAIEQVESDHRRSRRILLQQRHGLKEQLRAMPTIFELSTLEEEDDGDVEGSILIIAHMSIYGNNH